MASLSEEQKKRMEENRKRAFELRNSKKTSPVNSINLQPQSTNGHVKVVAPPTATAVANFCRPPVKANNFITSTSASSSSACKRPKTEDLTTGHCSLITRDRFKVHVPYHAQLIDIFKTIPSKLYDVQTKTWSFRLVDHNRLKEAVKSLSNSVVIKFLPSEMLGSFSGNASSERPPIPEVDLSRLDPVLLNSLLPFQREGVKFGISKRGRVLIADDMGLGKTIQAIAIAQYYQHEWPLLLVCPSSVKHTWKEAFCQWLPSLDEDDISIIKTSKDMIPGHARVLIISYDILSRRPKDFLMKRFQVVICDESHFLKAAKAARTKAAQPILSSCKRALLLSGTPALSRPSELFAQISAINPSYFNKFHEFGVRYCKAKQMPWGWDYSGSSNMDELKVVLEETVMIRRLKSEVISQLPAKRRQMILLDPELVKSNTKDMKVKEEEMMNKELKGMERRGALLSYFHETGTAKLNAVCDYIKDLLSSDRKFICFAHHQTVISGICNTIEAAKVQYMCIDGSVKSEDRKLMCDRFQYNPDCQVAVLSITAANAGITLTSASLVVFAELFWNPGILTQAEDRAHRIGQEDCVIVQYLVATKTADDFLWPLVQQKLDILNKAGLSKDNFSDATASPHKKSSSSSSSLSPSSDSVKKKRTLFDYFDAEDHSWMEDILLNGEEDC